MPPPNDRGLPLCLSRQDLASLSGVTREFLNLSLTELERAGSVAVAGRARVILDAAASP